jgi:two-component system, NtrC family, response regulator AtoC
MSHGIHPSSGSASARPAVLIVEDEQLLRWGLVKRFEKVGLRAEGAGNAEDALECVRHRDIGVVLLDLRLPGMDGLEALGKIHEIDPKLPVIMMTGHGAIETAVEAMRAGAHNYLTKPFDFDTVITMVTDLLPSGASTPSPSASRSRRRRTPRTPAAVTGSGYTLESLIGESPKMASLRALIQKVARSGASTVLLTGESGTGKDHVAKVIHEASPERERPFIHVNVAALSASLFEAEIFGHEAGAFTDAKAQKKGLLELGEGGTVYLDEIGDLEPAQQVNLLHVLENRHFKRVGGVEEIPVNVRFIAATNADLPRRVRHGSFRSDLYHRLRVIPLHLPPLRERDEDSVLIAELFLERFAKESRRDFQGFTPGAVVGLREHSWPGNIRELRNLVERACVLSDGEWVDETCLFFDEVDDLEDTPVLGSGAQLVVPAAQQTLSAVAGGAQSLQNLERDAIVQALRETGGNQVRAASVLGLGRDALRYRMKKYDLL